MNWSFQRNNIILPSIFAILQHPTKKLTRSTQQAQQQQQQHNAKRPRMHVEKNEHEHIKSAITTLKSNATHNIVIWLIW